VINHKSVTHTIAIDWIEEGNSGRLETRQRKNTKFDIMAHARDLRKISPLGRNDNPFSFAAFASLREIIRLGCGSAALGPLWLSPLWLSPLWLIIWSASPRCAFYIQIWTLIPRFPRSRRQPFRAQLARDERF
jgi:hypothetical protein